MRARRKSAKRGRGEEEEDLVNKGRRIIERMKRKKEVIKPDEYRRRRGGGGSSSSSPNPQTARQMSVNPGCQRVESGVPGFGEAPFPLLSESGGSSLSERR